MPKFSYPDFLEDAFKEGFQYEDEDGILNKYRVENIGNLDITEGKIIACDPLIIGDELSFTADFPTGQFPVELAIADIETDERTGFARIRFSTENPVRWEYALTKTQNPAELKPGDIYGYPVDSGTGSFMDHSSFAVYQKLMYSNDDYDTEIMAMMQKNYADTREWLLWEEGGHTVALFSTGYGDGLYQTYIGYDKDSNICRLVTDFGLIMWPE